MTKEHNKTETKAIEKLLEWNICERNKDDELKPTSDFLIWYYDHLIYTIGELSLSDLTYMDDYERYVITRS